MGLRLRNIFGGMMLTGLITVSTSTATAQNLTPTDRSNPQAVFNAGMSALEAGELENAIQAFERVLRLDPDAASIRALLGSLYLRIGNLAKAEINLETALTAQNIPDKTRDELTALLAEVRQQQKPYRYFGSIGFGLSSETNANGGPDDTGLITSGAAEEDISATLSGDIGFAYDLGYQDGRTLNLAAQFFGSEYTKETSPSSLSISTSAGLSLPLDETSRVAPYIFLSHVQLRGEPFRNQFGAGLDYSKVLNEQTRFSTALRIVDETFSSAGSSTNPERNGYLLSLNAGIDHQVAPDTNFHFGVNGSWKDARQDYEEYASFGVQAGIARDFDLAPSEVEAHMITAGLRLGYQSTTYDGPDFINSTTQARSDDRLSLGLFVEYPINAQLIFNSELDWTGNASNYATNDYDNFGIFVGLKYLFGQ